MEALPNFRLLRPRTVEEATALYDNEPGCRLIAGGTDLMVALRQGLVTPETMIDLSGVGEMGGIEETENGLRIGGGVRLETIIGSESIASSAPVLREAAATVAGPAHRTAATVAGNLCLDTRCVYYNQSEWWRRSNDYCLKCKGDTCHVAPTGDHCHAAFSGDLAPALMVLGADAEIASSKGRRTLALADLYRDDGADHLTLEQGEILVAVHVPGPRDGFAARYAKARVRGAVDFPLAGVAVGLRASKGVLQHLAVALTGTGSRPILVEGVEALLGGRLDDGGLTALGKLVQKQVSPMRTTLTAADYRRRTAMNMAKRLVQNLVA